MGSTGASSIGVSTGRLTGNQIGQLLSDRNAEGRVGTVSVGGRIPNRLFIDNENGRGGFTINMSGVSQENRNAFLRALRGRSNTDNSQRVYDRVLREARAAGRSEEQAVRMAQNARTEATRRIVDRTIERNNRFSGIRTTGRRVRR